MSAWWDGLAPAVATVTCGDASHELRWANGELRACDHDDIEGERTLAALGGERCTCADVLERWTRHASDVRVLVLGSRGPADRPALDDHRGQPRSHGWTTYAPAPWAQPPSRPPETDDLVSLLGLGGGVADRLVATVLATWAERLERQDCEDVRARLHAALFGRVVPAVRAWLVRPELQVEVEMVPPGGSPSLAAVGDGRVSAALPFAWLSTVWSRNLTTLMGRFCLDATTSDGRDWTLDTVEPGLDRRRRISVRLSDPREAAPAHPT